MAEQSKTPIERVLDTVAWEPLPRPFDVRERPDLPYATHRGILRVADLELECVQLSDGQRLITEDSVRRFFGWLNTSQEPQP